jgi:hypothetical protein
MSFLTDCAKTFFKCVAAGSGQMIGMAAGIAGTRVAGKVLGDVVDKVKESKAKLCDKPHRRMTYNTDDQ